MWTAIDLIRANQEAMGTTLAEIHDFLLGNYKGQEGVSTRLGKVEDQSEKHSAAIERIDNTLKQATADRLRWFVATATAAGLSILSAAIGVVAYLINHGK
jgi:hypothetical protein